MAERPPASGEPAGAFLDLLLGIISLSERMLASTAGLATSAPPRTPDEVARPTPSPDGPILR